MTEQRTLRFAIGDRVETAHGKHSALERGTIVELPKPYNSDEWYGVELDCGCCSLSLDWRADEFGRIRPVRTCEVCGKRPATRTYHDVFDGDAENGPSEPVETSLAICGDECETTIRYGVGAIECPTCGTRQRVTQTGTAEAHRDPTTTYKLACGHWTI